MNKRSGKNKTNLDKTKISIAPTDKMPKVAKQINASFLGSYSYFQPGRANQYDLGTDNFNGLTDIPLYIALMNQKNGGVLYFPTNLKQKYQFYRYFYRVDPYVGAAIDLHTDLPMSKMSLKMPKMQNQKRRQYIKKKYQHMCDKLDLFKKLRSILFQYYVIGNCFVFLQYNKVEKEFDKIVILPPQDCNITNYPFSSQSIIVYNQQQIIQLVKRLKSINSDYTGVDMYLNDQLYASQLSDMDKRILKNIPQQLLEHVFKNQSIVFDTDPYAGGQLGSFAFCLSRNKHDYATLGPSILQRVFVPLMQKLHYTYTQWSLASRNMTPRNKVTAPQVSPQQLQELRQQFDISMSMPQYSIVTNYDWNWEIVGADNRLIDLGRQYQVIENQIFAGLNVTRQVLTGQGMYSAGHINVQVMNAKYLLVRQLFRNMVQKKIFQPIAQENGFFDVDSDGFKHYYYPKLAFERLNIVDNDQNFDKLFNLYQKGSLPVGYIYQILNIDEQQATQKLKQDMFTVKDSTFNEMIRQAYNRIGDDFQQKSNLSQLIAKSIYVNGTQITFNGQKQQDGQSDNPFDMGGDNDDESSDNPFDVGGDEESKSESSDNPFDMEEDKDSDSQGQEEKQKNNKSMQKHSVQISDQDFRKFLQTQQLAVTDDDIKQFLKDQNVAVVKNKDLKEFLDTYFLKPTNGQVDQFMDVIDNNLHPNNKMFENFLQQLNITKVTNKQIQQFMKLFFIKPTNAQIKQFLKRYNLVQVTDDDVQQFLDENINQNEDVQKKTDLTDADIEQFINSQNSVVVNNQDINNFELMKENKFKI